jgi:hypothetical protein
VFGACKVDVSVGLTARANGSGTVRVTALFDRDAAAAIGSSLRLNDLKASGWTIEPAKKKPDGAMSVSVKHSFADRAEARRVLADVAPDALKGLAFEQRAGFWRTKTSFSGSVDLAKGIESFGDPALTQSLGGQPLGVSPAEIEKRYGAPIDRLFGLQVAVKLPGKVVESNAPTTTSDGAVWAPKLGEQVSMNAAASEWNLRSLAVVSAGSLVAAFGVVLFVRGAAHQKRRRRRR